MGLAKGSPPMSLNVAFSACRIVPTVNSKRVGEEGGGEGSGDGGGEGSGEGGGSHDRGGHEPEALHMDDGSSSSQ